MPPAALIWTGIVVVLFFAVVALGYGVYHRWHSRGSVNADRLYHRTRFELAMRAVALCAGFAVILAFVLGVSR